MRICLSKIALLVLSILVLSGTSYGRNSRHVRHTHHKHKHIVKNNLETDEDLKKNVIVVLAGKKEQLLGNNQLSLNVNDTSSQSSSEALNEEDSMEDPGDSDVSEERRCVKRLHDIIFRNEDDLINGQLTPVLIDAEQQRPDDVVSVIHSAFNNKKTFSCPKIKSDFMTGTSTSDLSPEDIGIIAAMGDSLATGAGLWPRTDIEFRGAAFPIGGDATIDGLVTIPNILREFSGHGELKGVSHGMGTIDQLPENQLNVASIGASSSSMPEQATTLVQRLQNLKEADVFNTWTMVIITIGTEETCNNCTGPNTNALIDSLDILNSGIHKAFVILLGPIHVSSSYHQKANLLKNRCECSRKKSNEFMLNLSEEWSKAFKEIEDHVQSVKRKTFNLLALPMLTITSRYPYSLFIPNKPLLNRRGHTYATKFLWNRLIAGEKYNLSKAVLSQDAYYCPSLGCPYFRIEENLNYCKILSHADARALQIAEAESMSVDGIARLQFDSYVTACVVISIAATAVFLFGTIFYQRSKKGTKGRFDPVPETLDNLKPRSTLRRKTGSIILEDVPILENI